MVFAKKWKDKYPLLALCLIAGGLTGAVIMALLLPGKVYEYITTAAGLMILYNWAFILLSSAKLLGPSLLGGVKRWSGLVLILAAVTGTLFHKLSRPGFYISLLIVALIALSDWIVQHYRSKHGQEAADKEQRTEAHTGSFHSLPGGPGFRIKGIRLRKNKI